MLVPSKKLFYAVEAVLYIAYNAKGGPISGREVAEAQGLPTRYLEPMMQKLVKAGILRGVRGPAGGYVIGRERRRITLADIVATLADDGWPEDCSPLGAQVLRDVAESLVREWNARLADVTVAGLCEHATSLNIRASHENAHSDFTI